MRAPRYQSLPSHAIDRLEIRQSTFAGRLRFITVDCIGLDPAAFQLLCHLFAPCFVRVNTSTTPDVLIIEQVFQQGTLICLLDEETQTARFFRRLSTAA